MEKNPKSIAKKLRMRNIIFGRTLISRQELLRHSGLSFRALDRYTADLQRKNMIHKEIRTGKQGRPAFFYRSNSGKLMFWGVSLIGSRFCLVILDINSYLLHSRVLDFPATAAPADLVRTGLELLDQADTVFPDMATAAIGFNFNTYLQPPERLPAFNELVRQTRRRYEAEIGSFESSSLNLLRLYTILGLSGSAGMLLFGDKIRLHAVTDGEIRSDLTNFLRSFRHRQIDRQSRMVCPECGKRGCINSLLTYGAVVRRYLEQTAQTGAGMSETVLLHKIRLQGEAGEPHARRILEENGRWEARALALLRKELHLDHLVVSDEGKVEFQMLSREFLLLTGSGEPILNFRSLTVSDSIYAAAEMMRRKVLEYSNTQ